MALLLAAVITSCNQASQKPGTSSVPQKDTVPVFLASSREVSKGMDFPAEILPWEQAELSAKVQGYVATVRVDIGDRVSKGQILATLRAPELSAQVAQAASSVAEARAKLNASRDAYERLLEASKASTPGIVAPVDLERSRNQMLADQASLEATQKQAQSSRDISSYLILEAPFSGIVTERKADPGDLVGANANLLTVQNNQVLRLRIAVPENFTATHNLSDSVHFKIDAFPDQIFAARLARKNGAIDPATRSEIWEYDFDNRNSILKSGLFANVHLDLARPHGSIVVPPAAIVTNQEKKFVIRIHGNKAEWVDVRQGLSTDNGVEIFGHLNLGDTLVVRATDELKPGAVYTWKIQSD